MRVLVTGACGGLGARVTELLAGSGDRVFAADIDRHALPRLKGLPRVFPLCMDVTSDAEVARARVKIKGAAGGLDAVACCAGIFAAGPLVEAAGDDMRRTLEVNLMGAFRVVKGFFPLLARPDGRVVLVSSEAARCSMPFNGPYTISKCALEAYADVLRRELMLLGVAVSVVQPGAFRTRLLEGAAEAFEDRAAGTLFPAQLARVRELVGREWERGLDAGEVARVVVRAVHARTPRARYRIGNDPLRVLLGRIPPSWTDRLIKRFGGA